MASKIQPGIYPDLPWSDYYALEALNASTLSRVLRSPGYARLYQLNLIEQKPNRSMMLGTALHALMLEPETFELTYAVAELDLRRKKDRAAKDNFDALGFQVLKPDEFSQVQGMAKSLLNNPTAKEYFDTATATEESAIWQRDGVLCKARKDLCGVTVHGDPWIADVKTTRDLHMFERDAERHGYLRQAAWYVDGDAALGRPKVEQFAFLTVTNSPPYESQVFELCESDLEIGRQHAEQLFKVWHDCASKNVWWTSPPEHVKQFKVSDWYWKQVYGSGENLVGFEEVEL